MAHTLGRTGSQLLPAGNNPQRDLRPGALAPGDRLPVATWISRADADRQERKMSRHPRELRLSGASRATSLSSSVSITEVAARELESAHALTASTTANP